MYRQPINLSYQLQSIYQHIIIPTTINLSTYHHHASSLSSSLSSLSSSSSLSSLSSLSSTSLSLSSSSSHDHHHHYYYYHHYHHYYHYHHHINYNQFFITKMIRYQNKNLSLNYMQSQ